MLISDFAIKKPLITVVSMLALSAAGLVALLQLKTDEFPEVSPPVVMTTIIYPGASPDQVERELLEPIEEAIQGIEGVDKVQSSASDGFAQIITFFVFEKDLQVATQDIRDAISAKRQDLPQEMEEPILKRFNPTDAPIVSLALYSERLNPAQLTLLADPGIVRELRSIPGVANVQISGSVKREMAIDINPQQMQAAGITVPQIVGALQGQNLAAPVGRLNGALDERTIRLKGRLDGPDDFNNMVVGGREGSLIRLGQVARAHDGTEEQRTLALYSGKEAIGIDITKTSGYSTTDVAAKLVERVKRMQETLPQGVTLDVVKNSGDRVEASVVNVQTTILEGAALTVLVVFLFLNSWRSTVITGLALPVSVLASFVAVWMFGFTLNTMSLLGLSLAIGILIDDAIVVRENIVRHVEMGKDHYTAAREGTDEIGLAVAATTFSIVSVFVPIGFLYGESGQWFKPFALTIACSVLVSLFVSFSLDPMLSAYWPDPHVPEDKKWWITKQLDKFNHWFNGLSNRYRKIVAWALDHPKSMVLLSVASLVFALFLPISGIVGGAFMPEDDRGEIVFTVEAPPGSNLDYTRLKVEEASRMARNDTANVRYTFATIGGASGAVDNANIYIRLKPKHERTESAVQLGAKYRKAVSTIGGAKVAVYTSDFMGQQKQIQIQIRGTNQETLDKFAAEYMKVVETVPGAVDVGLSTKGQKPELNISVERSLAGSMGLTVGSVAQSLRPAFAGIEVGDWVDPMGETRKVRVRLNADARTGPNDLNSMPLAIGGQTGQQATLPLSQVAQISSSLGPAIISHLDRDKVVTVEANTEGRALSEVTADIDKAAAKLQMPPGVTISAGGEVESQAQVFIPIMWALGVAVMLMYLVLVIQFGSFLDPLAILVSLPLSLIGVMGALALTRQTINIMSMIAMILLAGIVAKNAILLIDFAKWAREKNGMPLREALIEAGAIRLRPILMTTFALIAGMLPVAFGEGEGAQFRAPLGIAVIGGVATSTLLTLLVIPTFYEIMDAARSRISRMFGMTPPHTGQFKTFGTPEPGIGD
ncbi:MAG: efflux RND transporter permease subunit [Gemmatimonas sp.]